MNMKFLSKRGFTLIELMVVVAIIAILAAAGLFAYRASIQNARNSQRVSDMKATQNAMELYFTRNGNYGASAGNCLSGTIPGTDAFQENRYPANPGGGTTAYTCTRTATTYCACAQLEPAGTASRQGNSSGSCAGYAATGTHYCVGNQQ